MPETSETMSAAEVGQFFAERRRAMGLSQEQVAQKTSLSSAQYLSMLERGRFDVRRSKHFPELASLFQLTSNEIKMLNPDAVLSLVVSEKSEWRRPIPASLKEAAEKYGSTFPDLRSFSWLSHLASCALDSPDATPENWLDLYRALVRMGVSIHDVDNS